MKVIIINGPNLNLLGVREPGIYGRESMETFLPRLRKRYAGMEIDYYQSNVEGELSDKLQERVPPELDDRPCLQGHHPGLRPRQLPAGHRGIVCPLATVYHRLSPLTTSPSLGGAWGGRLPSP